MRPVRVLLDESVPRQLAPLLSSHSVSTVPREGWAGLDNGELLDRAVQRFDVLVTGDQSLQYQQNPRPLCLISEERSASWGRGQFGASPRWQQATSTKPDGSAWKKKRRVSLSVARLCPAATTIGSTTSRSRGFSRLKPRASTGRDGSRNQSF